MLAEGRKNTEPRTLWYLLSLATVALVGLIHLPFPFHGDTAFFLTGAQALHDGASFYVDFWDIKQPGVFLFFLLGGEAFGFSEVGIHAFELVYWLLFSVVLLRTVGTMISSRFIAALLPVFTVVMYYAASSRKHLSQLEALAAFPIFVAMWLAYRSTTSNKKLFLIGSGVAGGLAILLKLLFVVILVPIWILAAVLRSSKTGASIWKSMLEVMTFVGLGVLAPLALMALQLQAWGALPIAFETWFVYPPRIVSELGGAPFDRLLASGFWFITGYGPMFLLAVVGLFLARKLVKYHLSLFLATWFIFSSLVILMQRQSWWPYHFHLIGTVTAILAVLALDSIWARRHAYDSGRRSVALVAVLAAVVMLPSVVPLGDRLVASFRHDFARDSASRLAFQDQFSEGVYGAITDEVEFLNAPGNRAGPIYVAGDPLFYRLSGRSQATALNGWALEYFLAEQWPQLVEQIRSAKPPYVFIAAIYTDLIEGNSPDLLSMLASDYGVMSKSDLGVWYELT